MPEFIPDRETGPSAQLKSDRLLDGEVVRGTGDSTGDQVVSPGRGVRGVGGIRTAAGGGDGRGVGQGLDVSHWRFARCISLRLIRILSP